MNALKQQHKNEKVFNLVAPIYDKGLTVRWLFSVIKKTIKETPIKNNSKILDVGTGTGNLFLILQKNPTLELYGIDISEKMLNQARKKKYQSKYNGRSNEFYGANDNYRMAIQHFNPRCLSIIHRIDGKTN